MAFVSVISEEQASAPLKALYQEIRESFGFLPNYFLAQGRMPDLVKAQLALREIIMRDGALSKTIKAQLAVVVSGINASSYCVAAHLEMLRGLGIEKPLGRILATDYGRAQVP